VVEEGVVVTFREPLLLWLLAAIPPALVLLLTSETTRRTIARRFVSERLRGMANPARRLRPWLLAAALTGLAVALAGPRLGVVSLPVETHEANRVIVLDVSRSMAAEDAGGPRLDAAKAIAARLVDALPGRVGLVIFEQRAEVVSPLTTDNDAVAALLSTIQAGEVGDPGSDLAAGLNAGLKLLESDPGQSGDIVLFSDGEDQGGHADDAIARLRARGVPVTAIVIGSSAGATIPDPERHRDLEDDRGNVVRTFAQGDILGRIARATGGELLVNPFGAHALDTLAAPAAGSRTARMKTIEVPVERFQWPLAAGFLLMMLASLAHRGAE
jgi:Ca-activated chloride channel family protein